LKGRHATEIGHRAYQHPGRREEDYGQEIDRFSALVIYVSLAALERDPTLWERFHTGDNLIFVREDFEQVGRSAIWQHLRGIGSGTIDQLAAALATMAQQPPMKVSSLESVLGNLASFQFPTSSPASAPAQRAAPKAPPTPPQRVASKPPPTPPVAKPPVPKQPPTPPVPSWMKKSGYRQRSDD
jgi:hypothetical protein